MIYTCTFNPSIDYILELDELKTGQLNRSLNEVYLPGGKGINVSLMLAELNIDSTLLGFIGGFTGDFIEQALINKEYLHLDFTKITENTRINLKLQNKTDTEINANGPKIDRNAYQNLLDKINMISKNDIVILSGSVPSHLKQPIYKDIAKILHDNDIPFIIDSNKDHLMSSLPYHPFLIKPNKYELEELFNVRIDSDQDIYNYSKILMDKGAQNILVSLGANGAMLITKNTVLKAKVPTGNVINTVGSGDSMVAGFIKNYLKDKDMQHALINACACGSATAFSQQIGKLKLINQLKKEIIITKWRD